MKWTDVTGSLPLKHFKVRNFALGTGPIDDLKDDDLLILYEVGGEKRIARSRPRPDGPALVVENWATNCALDVIAGKDVVTGRYKGNPADTHKLRLVLGTKSGKAIHTGEVPPHNISDGSTWHGDEGP